MIMTEIIADFADYSGIYNGIRHNIADNDAYPSKIFKSVEFRRKHILNSKE